MVDILQIGADEQAVRRSICVIQLGSVFGSTRIIGSERTTVDVRRAYGKADIILGTGIEQSLVDKPCSDLMVGDRCPLVCKDRIQKETEVFAYLLLEGQVRTVAAPVLLRGKPGQFERITVMSRETSSALEVSYQAPTL